MVWKVEGGGLSGFVVERGKADFRESWGRKSRLFPIGNKLEPVFSALRCEGHSTRTASRGGYAWPAGPSTMGWHLHGTNKYGPGTARPGSHRARPWHGSVMVPCLGRHVSP
jgi:hypothetical protein